MTEIESFINTYAGCRTNRLGRDLEPDAPEFAAWLTQFNKLVGQRWPGCTLLDLAERPWNDWFRIDGDTPEQALAEVERDQGDELDEDFLGE